MKIDRHLLWLAVCVSCLLTAWQVITIQQSTSGVSVFEPNVTTDAPKLYPQAVHHTSGDNSMENETRPGLIMIHEVNKHLTAVSERYFTISPNVTSFAEQLKADITKKKNATDPWTLASEWSKSKSLYPERAPGLGDILHRLSTAPIISAKCLNEGTQLKIQLQLKGGQTALFKPKRYELDKVVKGGFDRHNGEIAAFHLGRVLGLGTVPISVGRRVSLKKEILPVSSNDVSKTSFTRKGQTCLYGKCKYCNSDRAVCEEDGSLEGVVIMWIPNHIHLKYEAFPWKPYRKSGKLNNWETDETFCKSLLGEENLLDLIDLSVFDFLIQNSDRHSYMRVSGDNEFPSIAVDNAKSFGDPFNDYFGLLAPLIQCCRIHRAMYEKLTFLAGGGMSKVMMELLDLDPLAPVLSLENLEALDRRVLILLAAISACSEKEGGLDQVLF